MSNLSLSLLIALINAVPILVWGGYFLHKHNEKRKWVLFSFSLGALSVIPLVFLRYFTDLLPFLDFEKSLQANSFLKTSILNIPLSLILFFVIIAMIEEYFKHKVADKVSKQEITSIDDAIEFSIMAALGFAFAENTFYLINIWKNLDLQTFTSVYLLRSVFSTFAHCLFSTVYGYYFGIALFSNRLLYDEKYHPWSITKLLKKVHVKGQHSFLSKIFAAESQFIGLFYATSLHAIFNLLLEFQFTLFLAPFFIFGLAFVKKIIESKETLKEMV